MKRFHGPAGATPIVAGVACVLLALAMLSPATAQTFPSKPVTIIVPFPPGGSSDVVARALGEKLASAWGQPVVVENRPGAAGNIGAAAVSRAAPDGHTLLLAAAAIAAAPALYKNPGFSLFESLTPVTLVGAIPYMLIVHPALPARTVGEFVAYAKAHPNELSLGSAGNGSIPHLAGEILRTRAGIDFVHVPYKGTSQAIVDLVAGQVQFTIDGGASITPLLETGKLRLLAVTTPQRLPQFPSTPTLSESGFPGFEASGWLMVLAPTATPKPLIEKLHADIGHALRAPDVEARMTKLGVLPAAGSTADAEAFLRAEMKKWAEAARVSGTKLD